jgi:hypothetical protein
MSLRGIVLSAIGMIVLSTVSLAVLKLMGVLAGLSWWVVFSPIWLQWAVLGLIAFCLTIDRALMRLGRPTKSLVKPAPSLD